MIIDNKKGKGQITSFKNGGNEMYNILVCDDEREIVDAIEIYLMQEGYQVLKAYDGEGAIDILKKQEVHLLIMDIMMPKLDGIRATMKIRENYSIPIIFLSAKSNFGSRFAIL